VRLISLRSESKDMEKVSFATRHPWDSRFWLVFLATSWLAIAIGFWEPIENRFTGRADYPAPWILVIHVWSYFGWMTLLSLQAVLINRRQFNLHRLFGPAGLILAAFVAFSGLSAEVYSQRINAARDPENIRFLLSPVFLTAMFISFAVPAFLLRHNSPAHKRLILLATSATVAAAYSRWWGDFIEEALGNNVLGTIAARFAGIDLILAAAIAFDLITRGRVHPVLKLGLPVLVGGQIVTGFVWHSDWWPPLGRHLLGLPSG
jgi:hypothetical protein